MDTTAARSTHPLIIIAALAVTLFSIAGIAALMGWLPNSKGSPAEATVASSSIPAEPPVAAPGTRTPERPAPAARVERARAQGPATLHTTVKAPPSASAPATNRVEPPVEVAAAVPPPPPAPVAAQTPKPLCSNCGVIETVRAIQKEAPATGIGAAAGGLLGGVVGHQLGNGRGRDVMTVVGAVGGAIAGHEIEKNRNQSTAYEVTVRYDDGTSQRFTLAQSSWRAGDRVRVVNGSIQAL